MNDWIRIDLQNVRNEQERKEYGCVDYRVGRGGGTFSAQQAKSESSQIE